MPKNNAECVVLDLKKQVLEAQQEFPPESLPEVFSPDANDKLEEFLLLDPAQVSYETFFESYIIKNRPCMFTTSLTSEWNVMQDWVTRSDGNGIKLPEKEIDINFDCLIQRYGNTTVSVTNCNEVLADYENPNCESMTIAEYIAYWKNYRDSGYPPSMPCLYLKDWHLLKNITSTTAESEIDANILSYRTEDGFVRPPYITPPYFASDWLNENCAGSNDDFRFAYMGPKGSWTPFHADVYGSFSWSANVIGTKKWLIYPPGKEAIFKNDKGKLNYNYDNPGQKDIDYYEVIQQAGQVIFIPSGWHHAVWNLEDTISINHNWINGANIGFIWANLKSELGDVINELDDLKDSKEFPELCQQLLLANHGMNYYSLIDLLSSILSNRKSGVQYITNYRFSSRHVDFDIKAISGLISLLQLESEVNLLQPDHLFQRKLDALTS